MKIHMKQGWQLAVKHFNVVILFFLYKLLWGFFLYRFIDSVVAPLLRRFPIDHPSEAAVRLFLTEVQFQLLKTDITHPYMWMLGGLLGTRMLVTPLFNAGLFHSLRQTRDSGSGTSFLAGIRKGWKSVLLLYWIETVLALAPGCWLLPRALDSLLGSHSVPQLLQEVLPGAGLWLLWATILHLLSVAMQFGAVNGDGIFRSLWRAVRNFLTYAALSIVLWAVGAAFGLAVSSLSMLWAGLIALIMHQGYHLIKTLLKVWTLASQFDYLQSKQL
ncbi:hypothetical protein KP806_24705 [Paenibacillus sp. N4]|uniref:hypothetical protein n=1 Tax=Paenibacillus vietnamensis TaxID=2590547 RepID=UPI001CD0988C|nr:hypothetical protein [Paenibacillus vietnamensis]MCA0758260.1 hypothetical protein [Paenibacillus vietnamensis]